MTWIPMHDEPGSVMERMPYGDGHFVRMAWRHRRDLGIPPLEGSAAVFVPGPIPTEIVPEESTDAPQEPVESQEDDAAPEERADDQDAGEARVERSKRRGR